MEKRNRKEYHKQWHIDNKEKQNERSKQYYIDNKEKRKEYKKQYYKDNKEKLNERGKQWRKNNPEKEKQYCIDNKEKRNKQNRQWRIGNKKYTKQYYKDNYEKINERANKRLKLKRKEDIQYNLNCRISRAMRYSLKANKNGRHWEDLINYTLTDLKKQLDKTMLEGYCWNDLLTGKLHIDHIIPIRAFIFKNPEDNEFKQCWSLYNLRLLPAKENIIKSDNITNPILLGLLLNLNQKEVKKYEKDNSRISGLPRF